MIAAAHSTVLSAVIYTIARSTFSSTVVIFYVVKRPIMGVSV